MILLVQIGPRRPKTDPPRDPFPPPPREYIAEDRKLVPTLPGSFLPRPEPRHLGLGQRWAEPFPEPAATRRRGRCGGWRKTSATTGPRVVRAFTGSHLAAYRPADGVIRVVIVKEESGCQLFFCTDPQATPQEIIEALADRAAIEQEFHDVKEFWGAEQQYVCNIWTNIAAFNRRKALRRQTLHNEYFSLFASHRRSSESASSTNDCYRWQPGNVQLSESAAGKNACDLYRE